MCLSLPMTSRKENRKTSGANSVGFQVETLPLFSEAGGSKLKAQSEPISRPSDILASVDHTN